MFHFQLTNFFLYLFQIDGFFIFYFFIKFFNFGNFFLWFLLVDFFYFVILGWELNSSIQSYLCFYFQILLFHFLFFRHNILKPIIYRCFSDFRFSSLYWTKIFVWSMLPRTQVIITRHLSSLLKWYVLVFTWVHRGCSRISIIFWCKLDFPFVLYFSFSSTF